jgi:ribonuclease HII
MFVVGVDENGLGPVLGALVSTAVTLEVEAYEPLRLRELGLRSGITDSKKSGGFGRMALCESVALALVESLSGEACADVDALLGAIAELGTAPLRAPCPASTRAQCWGHALALPAYGGSAAHGHSLLGALADAGVVPVRARTTVSCAGVLNAQLARGVNKLAVNLAAFERLVLDARAACGGELLAVCGMIGGIRKYEGYFRHFLLPLARPAERGVCAYDVPAVGQVRFEIDADDQHLPVALASMLGKYVRELTMERQSRYYRALDPALPEASGYHDPVTKRFIAESAPLRTRLGIVDDCFARRA